MRVFCYLKHKLFPSEDSDGVKVSFTDVRATVWPGCLRGPRGRRRRGGTRLASCGEKHVVREKHEVVSLEDDDVAYVFVCGAPLWSRLKYLNK